LKSKLNGEPSTIGMVQKEELIRQRI